MVGIKECANRITEMINEAKVIAGIPIDCKLKSIGLSLSGCEQVGFWKIINKLLVKV